MPSCAVVARPLQVDDGLAAVFEKHAAVPLQRLERLAGNLVAAARVQQRVEQARDAEPGTRRRIEPALLSDKHDKALFSRDTGVLHQSTR